jgi:nucleoside 2-deoxyribosyltransferase
MTPAEIRGEGGAPTPMLSSGGGFVTPKVFAAMCRDIVASKSGDDAHRALDQLVTRLLHNLGYSEGMAIFTAAASRAHTEATIYLCGPINGCTDEEANDWRSAVKATWPGRCIDPMRRDYRGREADAYREIVELDKIDVAQSDVILVNYDEPSVGTSMEVLYAWQIGKPVIVVCRAEAVISPWLRYHSHVVAHSFADALKAAEVLVG